MNKRVLFLGVGAIAMASFASANVTWTWNFAGPNNGSYTAGPTGITSTFGATGHSITVDAAQETVNGTNNETTSTGTLSTANTSTLNGLFQVDDHPNNNGVGIAPFDPSEGGSVANNQSNSFSAQAGISDDTGDPATGPNTSKLQNLLLINLGAVTQNEALNFLMNAGVTGDSFNVWTYYGAGTPTSLGDGGTAMTEVTSGVAVGTALNSQNLANAQYTYTATQAGNLWVAIQADCHYLLLDQIGASQPSAAPEPRFYGLLLVGMLALAIGMRRRFAAAV